MQYSKCLKKLNDDKWQQLKSMCFGREDINIRSIEFLKTTDILAFASCELLMANLSTLRVLI